MEVQREHDSQAGGEAYTDTREEKAGGRTPDHPAENSNTQKEEAVKGPVEKDKIGREKKKEAAAKKTPVSPDGAAGRRSGEPIAAPCVHIRRSSRIFRPAGLAAASAAKYSAAVEQYACD